ncbi:FtsX-like permease family protein [Allokutzneria sp. A3M-2-11 16]|uniref:FtsX-like permease family protein n=1 Tax=Allokutzneria sp. A3M-2-11 16 TaxID=2962043 RepID=UPI0020B66AD3|nr:FtsX-like permease family protein [Allokutzneria sp. A3M-2-11 16]MCP3799078.1 FtsX-like permease family protein [Allokutzneria sp. A3M-2-11 16]
MNPLQLAVRVLRADSRSRASALFTMLGVAVGVALVVWLAATPGAIQNRADRESWRSQYSSGSSQENPADRPLLVVTNYDDVAGQRVHRFDVAALKPGIAVAPGIPRVPGPGEVFLSPALAELAAGKPAAQLADRFPGKVVGSIGDEALSFPDELVAIVGHAPDAMPSGAQSRADLARPARGGDPNELLLLLSQVGLVILVVPCLVLVASAARLTAARRERRLAALRLAGATPQQVVWMTVAETAVASVAGTVLGLVVGIPLRSLTAQIPWDGGTWFPADFTPSALLVVAVLVLAPLLVCLASVFGLRRVLNQPLGAANQHTKRQPSVARLLLIFGAGAVFFVGLGIAQDKGGTTAFVLVGLAAVAIALVLVGPLVTSWVGKLFTAIWRTPATLLAGRRLRDDPKAAFRASSGVVVAVFAGSLALTMFPGLESRIGFNDGTWKDGVIIAQTYGAPAKQVASVRTDMAKNGITAPVLAISEGSIGGKGDGSGQSRSAMVLSCTDAVKVRPIDISACQQGPAIYVPTGTRFDAGEIVLRSYGFGNGDATDVSLPAQVPIREYQPNGRGSSTIFVDPALVPATKLAVNSVAVVTTPQNEAIARTAILRNVVGASIYSNGAYDAHGDTLLGDLRRVTVIGLAIATILGGVSAGVAAAGSVVDRRRTFGALIAAGTPTNVLVKALRREAMLPALVATVGASVAGAFIGAGLLTLAKGDLILSPWLVTPAVLGLVVALLAAAACGPVLRKVTARAYAEE